MLMFIALVMSPPRTRVVRQHAKFPSTHGDLRQLSPNAFAYVGDAVLELFWRLNHTWPPGRLADQQKRVVAAVRAEAQADVVKRLRAGDLPFVLTDVEADWLRRGRNAVHRRGPVRLGQSVYQDASGLECLVGFLYLSDYPRCAELLDAISRDADEAPRPPGEAAAK